MRLSPPNERSTWVVSSNLNRGGRPAFTLLEILVVVAIIVMLAGMAVGVMSYLERAREDSAVMNAATIKKALLDFKIRNGEWPGNLQELVNIGTLRPENLLDPWKQQYQFEAPQDGADDYVRVFTMHGQKVLEAKN
jgi:prepilin-type N-terminal cleavage/methylation domain-containing protein